MTEREEEKVIQISEEEYLLNLENQIESVSTAILNLQTKLLHLMAIKEKVRKVEELGLKPVFYQDDKGDMFFQVRPKEEIGFQTERRENEP